MNTPSLVQGIPPTEQPVAKEEEPTEDITKDIEGLDLFPKKKKKKKEGDEDEENGKAASTSDYYYKVAKSFLTSQTTPPPSTSITTNPSPQLQQPQQNQSSNDDGFVVQNEKLFEQMGKAMLEMTKFICEKNGVPMLKDEDEFSQIITLPKNKK